MADDHRPLRLVWALGLLILVASTAGTAVYLGAWPVRWTSPPTSKEPELEDVVAQGHVDVHSGVVALYPSQPGRVVEILAPEGQSVGKAEPIVRLDDRLARARKDEAEAAWKAAQTQLELARRLGQQHAIKEKQQQAAIAIAEQNLRSAEADLRRQKKLHESKAIPDELLVIAEAQRDRAKAMVDAETARLEELQIHAPDAELGVRRAGDEIEVARARLEQARLALDDCVIKSPSAGKVLRLQIGLGDMVAAQPIQPAITFCPDEPLIIRAEVPQEEVGRVHVGDEAVIQDDTGADQHSWKGKVKYVSGWLARRRSILLEPGQLNDVRTLECIIELTEPDPGLRIGQRVRVHIRPKTADQ